MVNIIGRRPATLVFLRARTAIGRKETPDSEMETSPSDVDQCELAAEWPPTSTQ